MGRVFKENITKEEMANLPLVQYDGKIVVVDTIEKFDKAIKQIFKSSIAGFDTETRPSFKKGLQYEVALLQIYCQEVCYLIRLNKVGFPDALRLWFEHEEICKVGLSLRDDVRELRKKRKITPNHLVDLQAIVGDYGIEALSLKKLSSIVLGKRISKRQQLSNWESETLTEAQKIYAATDAWVSLEIYKGLLKSKQ